MKTVLILLFSFFYTNALIGQCQEDREINTQAELLEFATSACKDFIGDLSIIGQAIDNLDPLLDLETISGDLLIQSTSITNFQGLNNLNSVGGYINIDDNNNLLLIDGFSNLHSLGKKSTKGGVKIQNNSQLTNINGFNQILEIHGNIEITENQSLETIGGFNNLESLQINLNIESNESLSIIENGFDHLRLIENKLSITENPNLSAVSFPNLITVLGEFLVRKNALLDLSDFASLELIGEKISINNSWPNLKGLDNLSKIGLLEFNSCNFQSIEDFLPNLSEVNQLIIINNLYLRKIDNFEQLDLVQVIDINNNNSLESISGFSNIQTIQGLRISENFDLISVTGFENLQTADALHFEQNYQLEIIPSFNKVERVDNLLLSANGSMSQIDGFHNLKEIGTLNIGGYALKTINAFINLERVRGLYVQHTNHLKSLTAFSNIKHITESLRLTFNESLTNIDLPNLESVKQIIITENHSLKEINTFEKIQALNYLIISENDSLQTVSNFSSLNSISSFYIYKNPLLEKINAFSELASIDALNIIDNLSLKNLPSFPSLKFIQQGLQIKNNQLLQTCCPILCWQELAQGEIVLENNSYHCNDLSDINRDCPDYYCGFSLESNLNLVKVKPVPTNNELVINITASSPFQEDRLAYEIWNENAQPFPTPLDPKVDININQNASLFDVEACLEVEIKINVSNYSKGVYFLKIIDSENKEEVIVRFIKI